MVLGIGGGKPPPGTLRIPLWPDRDALPHGLAGLHLLAVDAFPCFVQYYAFVFWAVFVPGYFTGACTYQEETDPWH